MISHIWSRWSRFAKSIFNSDRPNSYSRSNSR